MQYSSPLSSHGVFPVSPVGSTPPVESHTSRSSECKVVGIGLLV